MTWLSWRQQRTESIITAAILAVLAAVLIPTGIHMATVYGHAGLAACLDNATTSSCGAATRAFKDRFGQLGNTTAWLTLVPGIIGVLLAASFLTSLETGTYRLDWTQSITRRRWITTKLTMAAGSAALAALVLTGALLWWHAPLVEVQGRMANSIYDSEGTVVVAYTLFARRRAGGHRVVAGIGVVRRRAVPAMMIALAGYIAARVFVDTWLRQRLAPTHTATWNVRGHVPDLDRAWILNQHVTTIHGRPLTDIGCPHGASGACHPGLKSGLVHAVYQPASHFWRLQGVETTLFTVLAIGLIIFAGWWTSHRPD